MRAPTAVAGSYPGPVSYTHLDVYKRQLHDGSVVSMDHLLGYGVLDGQLLQLVGVVLLVLRGIGQCGGIPPVSYTHLDVYKRQLFMLIKLNTIKLFLKRS